MATVSLAPYTLKSYVENHLKKKYKKSVVFLVMDFGYLKSIEDIVSAILQKTPDVVCFSVYLWNFEVFCKCSMLLKKQCPELLIFWGGPQCSDFSETYNFMKAYDFIDAVSCVPYAGEIVFKELIHCLIEKQSLDTVSGIIYRNEASTLIITKLPKEQIDLKKSVSPYINGNIKITAPTHAVIETSRGCPYDCGFCSWSGGHRKITYYPMERIYRELDILYANKNVKSIYFTDSCFFANSKRSQVLLDYILKKDRNIDLFFEMDIRHITYNVAVKFAKITNHSPFHFAIQTTNPKALKIIGGRRCNKEKFEKKIIQLKKWVPNAKIKIDVMLGLPGDDMQGFKETVDFVLSLIPFKMVLNYPIYLLPGSRFNNDKDKLNLSYSSRYPKTIIETPTFPKNDILKALKWAIWVEILTYYYPAISNYFHSAYQLSNVAHARILYIDFWIKNLNRNIKLFPENIDLVDIATQSVEEWNKLKGNILRKTIDVEFSYKVYSTLYKLESENQLVIKSNSLLCGMKIFEHFKNSNVQHTHIDNLDQFYTDFDKMGYYDIKTVFSRFKD